VGYGLGPEIAGRLEASNIICNYQAIPSEEGFTAAGALRLGVSEMTRFGMEEEDFTELAGLIHDVVKKRSMFRTGSRPSDNDSANCSSALKETNSLICFKPSTDFYRANPDKPELRIWGLRN